ncbi:MAG TPA: hypothetical protein PLK94_03785 [Alphaproteobacteria bacterium]|nr:hypothetical protein [Alphaproteobacteria bacterium]HPR55453.1 hypothetical protein [Deltaproteobacteria bacterium]
MAKQINIVKIYVGSEEAINEAESKLERLVNDGWVIRGQCANGDSTNYFWVTLQRG